MSKASEYAKAQANRPIFTFDFGMAETNEREELILRHAHESVTVNAADVRKFIKWLRETFED